MVSTPFQNKQAGRCTGHGLHVCPFKTAWLGFDVGGKFPVCLGIWGPGDSNASYAQ